MTFYTIGSYNLPIIEQSRVTTVCEITNIAMVKEIMAHAKKAEGFQFKLDLSGEKTLLRVKDLKKEIEINIEEKKNLSYKDTLKKNPLSHLTHVTKIEFVSQILTKGSLLTRKDTGCAGGLSNLKDDGDGRFIYTEGVPGTPEPLNNKATISVHVDQDLPNDSVRLNLRADLLKRDDFFVAQEWSYGPFQNFHKIYIYYGPSLREMEEYGPRVSSERLITSINDIVKSDFKEIGFLNPISLKDHLISVDVPSEEQKEQISALFRKNGFTVTEETGCVIS